MDFQHVFVFRELLRLLLIIILINAIRVLSIGIVFAHVQHDASELLLVVTLLLNFLQWVLTELINLLLNLLDRAPVFLLSEDVLLLLSYLFLGQLLRL